MPSLVKYLMGKLSRLSKNWKVFPLDCFVIYGILPRRNSLYQIHFCTKITDKTDSISVRIEKVRYKGQTNIKKSIYHFKAVIYPLLCFVTLMDATASYTEMFSKE